MRVAVIVKNLTMGGMQRAAINLSETFAAQGHETHLIYFRGKNRALTPDSSVTLHLMDLEKRVKRTGVGALLLILAKLLNGIARYSFFIWQGILLMPFFKRGLAKLESEHGRFDLIIIRGQGTFEMIWPFNDERLVIQQVNVIRHTNERLHNLFMGRLFNHKQVVCNAQSVYSELRQELDASHASVKSLHVIPSPINFAKVQEKSHAYVPEYTTPYLINVGRFSNAKNLTFLIDAYAYARSHFDLKHHLVLVGDGAMKPSYLEKIETYGIGEYVYFTGLLENPYPWVKQADLFVFTSLYEGLPNVLLEALACHTNIVSTRGRGGTVDIMSGALEKNLTAFDTEAFARRVIEVLASEESIDFEAQLATYAPEAVVENYIATFVRS